MSNSEKMNILVLHKMGDPKTWLSSVKDLELCFPNYIPEHNYIIHNDIFPLPDYIKNIKFHGIILGSTFLCNRYDPQNRDATMKEYEFISYSNAFKIALPQDDYDCSAILEKWFMDWKVDLIYTVCPQHWEVLYPKLHDSGKIRLGYTGYISENLIERSKNLKPFSERTIDVSYRSKKQNIGYIRYVKGILGEVFSAYAQEYGLMLDVSTIYSKNIPGDKWLDFVENSKYVLCSNSGSSILDPYGDYSYKVGDYCLANPNAKFEEIEKACFPGEDNKWNFTAISPRNIEAALLESVQICVPGEYGGIMKPWEHYIPFEIDGSNIKQVIDTIRNNEQTREIAIACKKKFLSINELRYDYHARDIINAIYEGCKTKSETWTSNAEIKMLIKEYEKNSGFQLVIYRIKIHIIKFLLNFPSLLSFLRKIKYYQYNRKHNKK